MPYYVYVSDARNRGRIHQEPCSFIKPRDGKHKYNQGYWSPQFETYEEARAYARSKNKKDMKPCHYCLPNAKY